MTLCLYAARNPRVTLVLATFGATVVVTTAVKALVEVCPW